jgi:crotonobetainyl-CoA:carnitine CoA-transferase CaiB-like acyl-CoA transferase
MTKAEFSGGRWRSGGPLEGVRIIDLTSVVVGPLATQIMADYGADVIKVEAPSGDIMRRLAGRSVTDGMSGKFLHLNRNKRSITLDLKQKTGHDALLKLLADADVMIWNIRPAAMARLKLSYEDVRAINPRIISCGMFGFGQGGRYRNKPAYDSIIQGSAGFAWLNHRAMGEPRYVPMVIADRSVGLIAVQMICMCLYQRERTGEGQSIEIPMFENTAKAVLEEHMFLRTFEPPLGQTGDLRLMDASARPMPTKDGWICITANTNAQAFVIFDAIGQPELKTDPRFNSMEARFEHTAEYYAIRTAGMKLKTTAEWMEIFEKADVPAMPYQTLEQIIEDPHLKEVELLRLTDHPTEGKVWMTGTPNKLSGGTRREQLHTPKVGQQSVEILREIGYSEVEIKSMLETRATSDGSLDQPAK